MQCLSNSVLLLLACPTTDLTSTLCAEKGLAKPYQATVKGLNDDIDGSAEANNGGWCVVIDSLDHLLQHAGIHEARLLLAAAGCLVMTALMLSSADNKEYHDWHYMTL